MQPCGIGWSQTGSRSMFRGDIYLANLDPVRGSEADKSRPVIIVSNDSLNVVVAKSRRGVVTVVPLSSNVEHVRTFQVFLPADVTRLNRDSKAQAEQVRAIAVERLAPEPLSSLPTSYLRSLDAALRLHLALG